LGVTTEYLPLVFVGLATGFVFVVQWVACWFKDRNPWRLFIQRKGERGHVV
jgi:hypothetical protein